MAQREGMRGRRMHREEREEERKQERGCEECGELSAMTKRTQKRGDEQKVAPSDLGSRACACRCWRIDGTVSFSQSRRIPLLSPSQL